MLTIDDLIEGSFFIKHVTNDTMKEPLSIPKMKRFLRTRVLQLCYHNMARQPSTEYALVSLLTDGLMVLHISLQDVLIALQNEGFEPLTRVGMVRLLDANYQIQ